MKPLAILTAVILAVALCACKTSKEKPAQIDTILTRNIDVTGDGKPDAILLHLKAKSIDAPFSWSLSIISDGKSLLEYARDDSNIDKLFHDADYVSNCANYQDCKKKYYYHDILDSLVVPPSSYNVKGILDENQSNTLHHIGKQYLEKNCGAKGPDTEKILAELEKRLRNGTAIVISITTTPMSSKPLMMFAPEVRCFVPIYEE